MAGTQSLDNEWRLLKQRLDDNLSARSEAGEILFEEHIRAAQWRRMVGTADRWAAFCAAFKSQRAGAAAAEPPSGEIALADHSGETSKPSGMAPSPVPAALPSGSAEQNQVEGLWGDRCLGAK